MESALLLAAATLLMMPVPFQAPLLKPDLRYTRMAASGEVSIAFRGLEFARWSREGILFGLGDRRATSAKEFLVQLGVPADKLLTISYGKERPVCTESDESCWQRNRRAHFSPGQ